MGVVDFGLPDAVYAPFGEVIAVTADCSQMTPLRQWELFLEMSF